MLCLVQILHILCLKEWLLLSFTVFLWNEINAFYQSLGFLVDEKKKGSPFNFSFFICRKGVHNLQNGNFRSIKMSRYNSNSTLEIHIPNKLIHSLFSSFFFLTFSNIERALKSNFQLKCRVSYLFILG